MNVPAISINKACLSGLNAIALADQLIRAGEVEVVVAGGMESMTNAPHLLPGLRKGHKYGDVPLRDHMDLDGLTDAFDWPVDGRGRPTGRNARLGIGRAEQDAVRRPQPPARCGGAEERRLRRGDRPGRGAVRRKGEPVVITQDEGVRPDTTVEVLARLRPAFSADGTITAGYVLADLRRRRRGRGDEPGPGRGAGAELAGRDRGARQRGGPGQLAALPAGDRDQRRRWPRPGLEAPTST